MSRSALALCVVRQRSTNTQRTSPRPAVPFSIRLFPLPIRPCASVHDDQSPVATLVRTLASRRKRSANQTKAQERNQHRHRQKHKQTVVITLTLLKIRIVWRETFAKISQLDRRDKREEKEKNNNHPNNDDKRLCDWSARACLHCRCSDA